MRLIGVVVIIEVEASVEEINNGDYGRGVGNKLDNATGGDHNLTCVK